MTSSIQINQICIEKLSWIRDYQSKSDIHAISADKSHPTAFIKRHQVHWPTKLTLELLLIENQVLRFTIKIKETFQNYILAHHIHQKTNRFRDTKLFTDQSKKRTTFKLYPNKHHITINKQKYNQIETKEKVKNLYHASFIEFEFCKIIRTRSIFINVAVVNFLAIITIIVVVSVVAAAPATTTTFRVHTS